MIDLSGLLYIRSLVRLRRPYILAVRCLTSRLSVGPRLCITWSLAINIWLSVNIWLSLDYLDRSVLRLSWYTWISSGSHFISSSPVGGADRATNYDCADEDQQEDTDKSPHNDVPSFFCGVIAAALTMIIVASRATVSICIGVVIVVVVIRRETAWVQILNRRAVSHNF